MKTYILAMILTAHMGLAAGAPPMKSIAFFGRWDRRADDRAITINNGSYLRARFEGASVQAHFDLALNKEPIPTIAWRIDDGEWQEAEIAPALRLADGLSAGPHSLFLMVRGITEHQNRWKSPRTASLTFLGLDFPDGGEVLPPLKAWLHPGLTMEFLGDSITEGVLVQGNRPEKEGGAWTTDAPNSYAAKTALLLGAEWRQVGFGATGLAHGGSGGAPAALDSLNLFYEGCPRDDWQPDVVVINQGTNDGSMPSVEYRVLYAKYLALVRQAYPKARIAAVRPFCGAQAEAIKAEVAAARAAGDSLIFYIDTTGWYSGNLHPNAADSAPIAEHLAAALKVDVLKRSGSRD